ncbi:MAG: hypothetical protein ACMXYE_01290 [Candidatus Woesearchaeota archaeon]
MVKKKTTKHTTQNKEKKAPHSKESHTKKSSPHTKHSKSHTKQPKKTTQNDDFIVKSIIIAIVGIAIIAGIIMLTRGPSTQEPRIAATIGDYEITIAELSREYANLPGDYRNFVSPRTYLEEVMIPQVILAIRSSDISEAEVEAYKNELIESGEISEQELQELLEMQGITETRFKELLRIQMYLERALESQIIVTDAEVREFYELQQDFIVDELGNPIPFEEVELYLRSLLEEDKMQEAAMVYIDEIKQQTPITIHFQEGDQLENQPDEQTQIQNSPDGINTFQSTGNPICTNDEGKPIVKMFSTTWCPHCTWIKDTYSEVVMEYVERGDIVAYLWEVDIQEETLGTHQGQGIPESEMAIFQQYNPQGTIPTFVFGCSYSRTGNGYESQNDLNAERAEFRAVIDRLLEMA